MHASPPKGPSAARPPACASTGEPLRLDCPHVCARRGPLALQLTPAELEAKKLARHALEAYDKKARRRRRRRCRGAARPLVGGSSRARCEVPWGQTPTAQTQR
jgi:hypothetical protein